MRLHSILAGVLAVSTTAGMAHAQSGGVPAEFPPADYAGNQYVDSNGCAFIRAGISGVTNWVPRVDRTRTQLCNFTPTFATSTETDTTETDVAAAVEAPAVAAPLVRAPTAAERAGAMITLPAATAPATVPAAPLVDRPPLTLADVCEGKYGIQPGFISSSTGIEIDCGPAPAGGTVAAAPAVVPTPTVDPVPRMTMAEICEAMANSPIRYTDANTGKPIECPGMAAPTVAAAPTATVAPSTGGAVEMELDRGIMGASCNLDHTERGHRVVCDPVSPRTKAAISFLGTPEVPASNPTGRQTVLAGPPKGYEPVWDDGRLNTNRGLQTQRAFAVAPRSNLSKPFIQVGSFGVHANADQLVARLQSLGIPAQTTLRGNLMLVAAGPFADGSRQQTALQTIRGMGFSDAYLKN